MNRKIFGFLLGPILFTVTLLFFKPQDLSEQGVAVLASTLWIAAWWITEALPIAVTSMMPIVLFPLTGALSLKETSVAFGDKYIFLYIGGFILSIAIEKWHLHKRIALTIIKAIGSNSSRIVLGFMLATAFMSMWISNTAAAVMMMPIGMAIVKQFQDHPETPQNENIIFGKSLMLAIAYSASIGGIATLIGTPPNIIFAGVVQKFYNTEITFLQWFKIGFPLMVVMLVICWVYLTRFSFKLGNLSFPGGQQEIKNQLQKLGKIKREEKRILLIFVLTALSWMLRSYLLTPFFPALDDTIIAMMAVFALFVVHTKSDPGGKLLHWKEAERLPWGILLLFGGGLAIAQGFEASGLALWIGNLVGGWQGISLWLLVVLIVAMVNFLTEITSNLATTAMLLPVLIPVADSLGVNPYVLLVGATLSASCAFMLPVATPPNAVVFGSGYLRVPDMMKTGIMLNLISILLISLLAYWLVPMMW